MWPTLEDYRLQRIRLKKARKCWRRVWVVERISRKFNKLRLVDVQMFSASFTFSKRLSVLHRTAIWSNLVQVVQIKMTDNNGELGRVGILNKRRLSSGWNIMKEVVALLPVENPPLPGDISDYLCVFASADRPDIGTSANFYEENSHRPMMRRTSQTSFRWRRSSLKISVCPPSSHWTINFKCKHFLLWL